MPRVDPIQNSFNSGEISPLVYGRSDSDRYKSALAVCLNWIPTIQGGLIRRPGSYFVAEVKDSSKPTRLQRFEFSTTQAYMIEFGDLYIRFHKDNDLITLPPKTITGITNAVAAVVTVASHGYSNGDRVVINGVHGMLEINNREYAVRNVTTNTFSLKSLSVVAGSLVESDVVSSSFGLYLSGGTVSKVYEISSLYTSDEVFDMKFTQSADVLYIAHPNHTPSSLSRSAHTAWFGSNLAISDGPYLPLNKGLTTLTPGSSSPGLGVTLTANNLLDINDGQGFLSTDVGRPLRVKEGSTWGWAIIASWVSTTVVTINIITTFTNTTAKAIWRLGSWSQTYGYPRCVVFHEDRLIWGGAGSQPQALEGSRTSDYNNFSPSDADGTVTATHAIQFILNSNDVNALEWVTSDEKGLLAGTRHGEWVIQGAPGEALSSNPPSGTAKQATSYGGNPQVQPVQVGKATLFVQRAGRKVREFSYFYDVDGFRAADLTLLSEHITGNGLKQLAYQREPQSIVWGVRNDGVLSGLTYERETDALKVGWHRHIIGGYSDSIQSPAIVESVQSIPSSDGKRDEVWLIVRRYINGSVRRFVEYLTPLFDQSVELKNAFQVDGGLTYDGAQSVSSITTGTPIVVTCNAHGYSDGDSVQLSGFALSGLTSLNDVTYVVANKTTNTFELLDSVFPPTPGVLYSSPIALTGVVVRKFVTTITGLGYLEGETLTILGDGAVVPDAVVTNGALTLQNPVLIAQIGYHFNSDGQQLRLDAGSATGTAVGKKRRTHIIGFLLHRTLGFKFGMNFDEMDEVTFRNSGDDDDAPVPLFSGVLSQEITADYDMENQVCFRQDQPLPGMVLAIMPQMVTQDRG